MRTCKEQCTFGLEYDQCCIKCERYPECPAICDSLDEYEFTENCPSYIKGEEDGKRI